MRIGLMTSVGRLPKSVKQFIAFLETQKEKTIKSGDWSRLNYELERDEFGIKVRIPSAEIGICFDKRGKLEGIYNYKD